MKKRNPLGKGLGALISESGLPEKRSRLITCDVDLLKPSRRQPRRDFDEGSLAELADSIAEKGVIQPVIVRRADGGYEIVAGERRWRAAQRAGLREIPALVVEADDAESVEISLIENIHRKELSPLEEAEALAALSAEFGLSHEELARRLGKKRSTITNTLRILKLPEEVKKMMLEGALSLAHAKLILSLESRAEQISLAREIKKKNLSVRETEKRVKRLAAVSSGKPARDEKERAAGRQGEIAGISDRALEELSEELSKALKTKVRIRPLGDRGRIEIVFFSVEQLEEIVEKLRSG